MNIKQSVLLVVALGVAAVGHGETKVTGGRFWHGPDKTRMVFDISAVTTFQAFVLMSPDRFVIDIDNTILDGGLPEPKGDTSPVTGVRTGQPKSGVLRVVLDLKRPVKYQVFVLEPNSPYPYRLVVDLFEADQSVVKPMPELTTREDDYLVIIDPGHGGEDPGAIGKKGTLEKTVALGIARRLKRIINHDGRMRAQLTRNGDYYVTLRGRVRLAMSLKADAFISIHADAARRRSARGSSIYVLSQRGASSEMGKWLAKRENAADLAGGVDIGEQDPGLQKALLDMGIDWKIKESKILAARILAELKKAGQVHSKKVEEAGFAVLKSVDIPAVLVETGFITNANEEKALTTALHQERIAGVIFRGLDLYCDQDPRCPPVNQKRSLYEVRQGDSLSLIAVRVGSTVEKIRALNNLPSDVLRIGQKLRIPSS
ncbi:MAG: N-acetylmuramoyl-L-alanine amidase [Arenicellales bacterium]